MVVRGAPAIGDRRRLRRSRSRRREGDDLAAGRRGAARARGRRPSTSPGRSTRCATTRRPSTRAASTPTRSPAAGAWRRTRPTLFAPGTRALTHCNAGGLATGGYGSAVGALLTASERGLLAHVWVDETRPLLQGARLTAWELEAAAIPHAVIADSAAASLMAAGEVDCVVTGADRIAANGDTANKIGTYSLAVLARYHGIPLYIVAPSTTVDHGDAERRRRSRSRSATRRDHRALPGAEPRLRRHAVRADHRDRHRARRSPRAVRSARSPAAVAA